MLQMYNNARLYWIVVRGKKGGEYRFEMNHGLFGVWIVITLLLLILIAVLKQKTASYQCHNQNNKTVLTP
jgi:uncharacterized membrane protein